MYKLSLSLLTFALIGSSVLPASAEAGGKKNGFNNYDWTEVNEHAPWVARAGLEAVVLDGDFYILGGRTPNPWVPPFLGGPIPGDSTLWGDVWRSPDRGESWVQVLATDDEDHWAARSYHEVVTMDGEMYLLGGQNYMLMDNPACDFDPECFPTRVSTSEFFNDVWRSADGVNWTELTNDAPWHGRAGLSSIVFKDQIFVLGGSFNDDSSIIGGQPERVLFNDVWSSPDGINWVEVTAEAPWAKRAGAALVVKNGYLWLLGGEFGFFDFPPPYFNDVWRSKDGIDWEIVTPAAGWSARPGHQCGVIQGNLICFGGFGDPENPVDVWTSGDGSEWTLLTTPPWNARSGNDIKYDFDIIVTNENSVNPRPAIYTFGGDRETFDFDDPLNYLRVDSDVWIFTNPEP